MKGKERDKQLAESLRDEFINKYNDETAFQALLEELGDNCLDRMVHCLKTQAKIDFFRDYMPLKNIAAEVLENNNREIFSEVCIVDDARAWINDNGRYKDVVFDALYRVYRRQAALQPFIKG